MKRYSANHSIDTNHNDVNDASLLDGTQLSDLSSDSCLKVNGSVSNGIESIHAPLDITDSTTAILPRLSGTAYEASITSPALRKTSAVAKIVGISSVSSIHSTTESVNPMSFAKLSNAARRASGVLVQNQLNTLGSNYTNLDESLDVTESKDRVRGNSEPKDMKNNQEIYSANKMKQEKFWNNGEFFAEFMGTFILMVINNMVIGTYILSPDKFPQQDPLAMAMVAGIGAMLGIMSSLRTSGGHINPAVTIAFAVTGKLKWRKVPHYIAGQCLGSFTAQVLIFITYYDAFNALDGGIRSAYGQNTSTAGIFATFPPDHVSLLTAMFDQVFGTAMLLIAVSAVGDNRGVKLPEFLQPVIIMLLVTALAAGTSHNCGAILNPARDLIPRVFCSIAGWGWEVYKPLGGHYWYVAGVIGPIVGAIIGCYTYHVLIGRYLMTDNPNLQEKSRMTYSEESINNNNLNEGFSIELGDGFVNGTALKPIVDSVDGDFARVDKRSQSVSGFPSSRKRHSIQKNFHL